MIYRRHNRAAGFTLTEMAIVLGVVGVLVAGLWNLISGASQQARDESAASQQGQLIAAAKGFLGSPDGQTYMTTNSDPHCAGNCGPNTNFSLPLPANAGACVNDGNLTAIMPGACPLTAGCTERTTWCNMLPPGFSAGTVNSYGQTFSIRVLRDASGVGQAPNSYSFMIATTGGGVTIPDTSGSRIAALIGGDGGFIYTANVCGAPATTACGSYGGWTATVGVGGYGFGAGPTSGDVASRSYVTPQLNALSDWLARVPMPGDTTFVLNTMTTPEYLGGNYLDMGGFPITGAGGKAFNLEGGSLNFLNDTAAGGSIGGKNINAQGGNINMGAGIIDLQGGQITSVAGGTNAGNDAISLNGTTNTLSPFFKNSLINAGMPCTIDHWDGTNWVTSNVTAPPYGPNLPCGFAITSGSIVVSGLVSANGFYAGTFIYNASDATLKKDIKPLINPLQDIEKLRPVSFAFKDSGKESMGVVAQEVEKVYPQLVSTGDKGKKYVSYDGFIAPLIGAVQQLKQENDDLRVQLKAQQTRQDELEKELQKSQSNKP